MNKHKESATSMGVLTFIQCLQSGFSFADSFLAAGSWIPQPGLTCFDSAVPAVPWTSMQRIWNTINFSTNHSDAHATELQLMAKQVLPQALIQLSWWGTFIGAFGNTFSTPIETCSSTSSDSNIITCNHWFQQSFVRNSLNHFGTMILVEGPVRDTCNTRTAVATLLHCSKCTHWGFQHQTCPCCIPDSPNYKWGPHSL